MSTTTPRLPSKRLSHSGKVLPGHARSHNRALVLQTLYRAEGLSRADVARETGLTRVTVSDLVAELIDEGYVVELGQREGSRPGKPAILLDIHRTGHQIVGLDLSDHAEFRAAVLDLDAGILHRESVPIDGAKGDDALERVAALLERALAAATAPVLGVGVGSPGVVGLDGRVHTAPNLGWTDVALREELERRTGVPVVVSNDADAAVLAENAFGGGVSDTMLVRIGHGVGAGLILGGLLLHGSAFAAGEIGLVMVGTDEGIDAPYNRELTLEGWLSVPRLEARLAAADDDAARSAALTEAGQRLGVALAPVVGALNLAEVVLSGPERLLEGELATAALETIRRRTMADSSKALRLRMTELGQDIVLRGAAVLVLSGRLGVS